MRTAILSFPLIVATMAGAPALGQGGPAALVADLADGPSGAAPFQNHKLTALGDTLFFAAHGVAGFELWRTDGTAAGTALVADVCPGPCASGPHSGSLSGYGSQGFFVHGPVAAGGELFFVADDGVRGFELWNTDGTASGTRPVGDFDPYYTALHRIEELTARQDRVYFVASDAEHGLEVRRAGAGERGVSLVADLVPGPPGSEPRRLVAVPAGLFFAALDEQDVWVSDGTPEGTRRLLGESVAGVRVAAILAAGDGVLFDLRHLNGTPDAPHSLWISDGSFAGTRQIRDLGSRSVANLASAGGRAFFQSFSGSDRALWVSDGTAAGTAEIGSLPGPIVGPRYVGHQGALYYAVDERVYRATGAGPPVQVASLTAEVDELTAAGGVLFALTDDGVLWRSAGGAGPFQPVDTPLSFHGVLTPFGNRVYSWTFGESGGQLASLGADGGLELVTDFRVPDSSDPSSLVDHQGTLLFAAGDGFFESRGSAATTVRLAGVSEDARAVSVAGEAWIFDGPELRIYDGDGQSSLLRDDLRLSYPGTAVALGGRTFFVSSTFTEFILWSSDGTPAGTVEVQRFDRVRESCLQPAGTPCRLARAQGTVLAGRLLLLLEDELWSSDGQPGNAVRLLDVNALAGCGGCWLEHLTPVSAPAGERAFFVGTGHEAPTRLWVSDGTAEGTEVVVELAPPGDLMYLQRFQVSPLPPPARDLTAFAGRLFFARRTAATGDELWTSDGTAAGTVPVFDLRPGPRSSNPRGLLAAGGRLYFAADDGVRGRELWVTDGTAAGTELVADVLPGSGSSYPEGLTVAGDRLVFAASDAKHGRELWQSRLDDGRTGLVQDVGGASSSSPRHVTVSGPRLYFNAFTEDAGFELWSAALAELPDVTPCRRCPVFP